MKTDELREKYLSFFEQKGCVRKPSDVLVPRWDPTVLFTPAGMNQFKNQFLGIGPLEFTRATTCQKCLRTGDIENVGVTAYHHTFFEMLGNFSFGDYFKREAIHWAWEFLTAKQWLGLAKDRLQVTVYLDDDEAYDIWNKEVGLSPNQIRREGESENFWPASAPSNGPDGVCGPCSEIYYQAPHAKSSVEIWNLVFTQFNRVGPPPGNLKPLPKNNIDTGMGLERTAAVLQGVDSNFENDLLRPLCVAAGEVVGREYSYAAPHGRPLRRIADHVRAVSFSIHEECGPGNEKQGYVVRQLLRRAVLEGYLLGKRNPFLHELVPAVAGAMRGGYPDLGETVPRVQMTIRAEEEQFLGTIERGLRKLEKSVENARKRNSDLISGEEAFDLHQTDGFLIELTDAFAAEHNLRVDRAGYQACMERHQQISGRGAFADSVMKAGPLDTLRETAAATEFLGYETTEADAKIIGIVAADRLVESLHEVGHSAPVAVVLDRSPFYGESGGQVGDTGRLTSPECVFEVQDTQRQAGFIVHIGHLRQGSLRPGLPVRAEVDHDNRAGIRRAHTATHLLHHALQSVLGGHATQRGSRVERDLLRFDFTHSKAVSREQLCQIEDIINRRASEAAAVQTRLMGLEEARRSGATALFGEKYAEQVRVVSIGDFSRELCGGTHLGNTAQVGICRIVSEGSVAAGTRRIVAQTGALALSRGRAEEQLLLDIAQLVKAPRVEEIPTRVEQLTEEVKTLRKELAKHVAQAAAGMVDRLAAGAVAVNGVKVIAHRCDDWDSDTMRGQIEMLRKRLGSVAVLLASGAGGKVLLMAGLSTDVVARGHSAVDWVKVAAKPVGGGGGGRPELAQAGGKQPDQLDEALQVGMAHIQSRLA